jgi:hypothetical protein
MDMTVILVCVTGLRQHTHRVKCVLVHCPPNHSVVNLCICGCTNSAYNCDDAPS